MFWMCQVESSGMLNYQSTSFHDALAVRQLFGLRPAPEFATWLEERRPASRYGLARRRQSRTPANASALGPGSGTSREIRLMSDATQPLSDGEIMDDDVRRLHAMGYAQELARRLGGFSNFALSLSIICILAGGVTSFHLGLCSVGGASIGLGWPLVSLFALAVAATMGQLASTFPTAGGLYHWSAILGGRGWGWATAWFNLAGLITVLAAINVGTYRFAMAALGLGSIPAELDLAAQAIGVILITGSQAAINHLGIVATARLTDFSGYWILLVAAALTVGLLAFAPGVDPSRLVTFANYSGSAGGDVWPATEGLVLALRAGCALARVHDHRLRRLGARGGGDRRRLGERAAGDRPLRPGLGRGRLGAARAPWCWPRPACRTPRRRARGRSCGSCAACCRGHWRSRCAAGSSWPSTSAGWPR